MARTLTLTDPTLSALGTRPDILRSFPFMKMSVKKTVVKSTCCRRSVADRQSLSQETERVKKTLLNLPSARIRLFKQLIGAGKLILFIRLNGQIKRQVI